MKITPMDISHKEFGQAFRGYNPQEVRTFLTEIGVELENHIQERARLLGEIDSLKKSLERYHSVEESLQKTLLMAQKASEDTLAAAKHEAELIVEEARRKGEAITEAHARAKAMKSEFIIEFAALINAFNARLKQLGAEDEQAAGANPFNEP